MVVNIQLSEEQGRALEQLLSSNKPVQILAGYAGTGKTEVVRRLKEARPGYAVCAFTGKAANVIRRKGVTASTIHSLIYNAERVELGSKISWSYSLKRRADLGCSGFIVDEASMVGEEIWNDLSSYGLPIILVGDHGQLPPIQGTLNLMLKPHIVLKTIHRNAGPIARFAEWLRLGKRAADWPGLAEAEGRVRVVTRTTEDQVTDADLMDYDQVIVAFNNLRCLRNQQIRGMIGLAGDPPSVDERVMCLKNNRYLRIFNGMQGTIESIDHGNHTMVFVPYGEEDNPRPVNYYANAFGCTSWSNDGHDDRWGIPFDWAYAITCHKAQGDEWDSVLVYEGFCRAWEPARWAYTAATRAREKLLWVTP